MLDDSAEERPAVASRRAGFRRGGDRVPLGPLRSLTERRRSFLTSGRMVALLAGLALAAALTAPALLTPREPPPAPRAELGEAGSLPSPVVVKLPAPARTEPLPQVATVPVVAPPAPQPVVVTPSPAPPPPIKAEAPAERRTLTLDMLPVLSGDTPGLDDALAPARPPAKKPPAPRRAEPSPTLRGTSP